MSEYRPEFDVELREMFLGLDGGQPFEKALIESALGPYLARIGTAIMDSYFAGKATVDDVLEKIRELDQPEPVTDPTESGLGAYARAHLEIVKAIAGTQYPDYPQFREEG